jgi:hypothetical protein
VPRRGYRFIAPVSTPLDAVAEREAAAREFIDDRRGPSRASIAAVALAAVVAALLWPMWDRPSPAPIPIAVMAVDVDAATPHLKPVSRTLTEALTGTLVSAIGDRGRVASPMVAKVLAEQSLEQIRAGGTEYVVLVTLRSLGGPILVHVKLVHSTGWVKWASEHAMPLDQLEREQLRLATELSKQVADAITRS